MITLLIALICALLGAWVGKLMAMTTYYLPPILLEGCDRGREPTDIIFWFLQKPFSWHWDVERRVPILEGSIALFFGLSALWIPVGPHLVFVWIACCLLICCFITDFDHQILPDQLTLSLVWVGLIGSLHPIFISPREAIIGAVFGYAIFWGFNCIYRWLRGFDGIYPGDFKLNAGIGACVGYKLLIVILLVAMASLVVVTLVQTFYAHRKVTAEYFFKEIAYACFASVAAIGALLLLLLELVPHSLQARN